MHRTFRIALCICSLLCGAGSAVAQPVANSTQGPAQAPTGLLCDLLEHPEETVITTATPEFGWIYNPSFRNDAQAGYRIIVGSSQTLARQATGDLWDSGVVSRPNSLNVPYAGAALRTNTDYYWSVQTVDSAGHTSPFSTVQHFRTDAQLVGPPLKELIYNVSSNIWANRYPLRYVTVAPVFVTNTAPGDWFVDFGQDSWGYAAVHLNASFAGTNVQARFGEMATNSGVNTNPPDDVRYYSTVFTLQNGDQIYPIHLPPFRQGAISPPSSYGIIVPFRYFELTNFPGPLTVTDVWQERIVSEFNTNAASFTSSSTELNQIWKLCHNSMEMMTFDGIYVDGDRQREPYEGDGYIQLLSEYAVDREYTMARYTFEFLLQHPRWPVAYKFDMIFFAWADYLQTGNTDWLAAHYDELKPRAFTWAATNGLMVGFPRFPHRTNSDFVDWPESAPYDDGFVFGSGNYLNWTNAVNNAYYYHGLQTMANIAGVLGRTDDATNYAALAAQVYRLYTPAFWDNTSQSYVDGVGTTNASAAANFYPLDFGLVPAANEAAVINHLHARIAARGAIPTDPYGAQFLLEALFQHGDADTALGLITTNNRDSWMNMINSGSTLTTEYWYLHTHSSMDWNHAWGSAAANLITRFVLGVRPLTGGYGRILIQPQLGRTLSYVQGTVPTVRGPVSVQATNAPGLFRLWVDIPGNVTATVMLPGANTTALVDGETVVGAVSNNWLAVPNIGSGHHAIWMNHDNTPSQTRP